MSAPAGNCPRGRPRLRAAWLGPIALALALLAGASLGPPRANAALALESFTQQLYAEAQIEPVQGLFSSPFGHFTEAGGHPFALETAFRLDLGEGDEPRDVSVKLSPGLLGNPQNTPQCSDRAFTTSFSCDADTAIGFVSVPAADGESLLYNLDPPAGYPAAFGFTFRVIKYGLEYRYPMILLAHLDSSGGFGVRVGFSGLVRPTGDAVRLTLCDLGVELATERERLEKEAGESFAEQYRCSSTPAENLSSPFLDSPTRCGPITASGRVLGWQDGSEGAEMTVYDNGPSGPSAAPGDQEGGPRKPTTYNEDQAAGEAGILGLPPPYSEISGCEAAGLQFAPSGSFVPGNTEAGEPAGDGVQIEVPQPESGFLALAPGKSLHCAPGDWAGPAASTLEYRWLRDGAPITGEGGEPYGGEVYGLREADQGRPIQCQVFATSASGRSVGLSEASDRWGPFAPDPAPPMPEPEARSTISGAKGAHFSHAGEAPSQNEEAPREAEPGNTLTCDPHARAWTGEPRFSYRWLRNGAAIEAAEGGTSATYTVRAGDTNLQCEVIAHNAAGEVAAISLNERVQASTVAPEEPANSSVRILTGFEGTLPPLVSALRSTLVKLPEGVVVSPAGASGLEACSAAQIGLQGIEGGVPRFSEEEEHCPQASKLGTIEICLPMLDHPSPSDEPCSSTGSYLKGAFYLAEQYDNPFGSMLALYLVASDPRSGIIVKLAAKAEVNGERLRRGEGTGQLTVSLPYIPPIPFESLKLHFFGGPRAALANPRRCGTYSPEFSFTPWTFPFQRAAILRPGFTIGQGCTEEGRFSPTLSGGTSSSQAAAPTTLAASVSRSDQDQELERLTIELPPGLSGRLSRVVLCGEPQAADAQCPQSSRIGYVEAVVGPGADPLAEPEAGKGEDPVYLTGPYGGAPFGLSIAISAQAGPLNFGTEVVRAKVNVNAETAALTITTGALPRMLHGIPLQIRTAQTVVDREGFIHNPTDCAAQAITATISGVGRPGRSSTLQAPLYTTDCAALPFSPSLSAQTRDVTSREDGTSLAVELRQTPGEADLKRLDVQLPSALATRLRTLQRSCTEQQFAIDPAACPAESFVGSAIVHTPLLAEAASGPAILVSHASAALPDIVIVLQGEGATVKVASLTRIPAGITYADFEAIPDAPVESLEATFPAGPHSIFAATGEICEKRLLMPATLEAQSGRQLRLMPAVSVRGCPPTLTLGSHRVRGRALALRLDILHARSGTLSVSGRAIGSFRRRIGAGGHTLHILLSRSGLRALSRHRLVTVGLRLQVGGRVVRKAVSVRL